MKLLGGRGRFGIAGSVLMVAVALSACGSTKNASSTGGATSAPSSPPSASRVALPTGGLSQAQAGAVIDKLEGPIPKSVGHTVRGISGHTITIEGVADVTAGGQTVSPGACLGAKARFAAANRAGGIAGYKINYVGCQDSQSSSATALQDVQKAVQVDHAFAIVPMMAGSLDGSYLNKNHVPYFGLGLGPAYCPGWSSLAYGFSPVDGVGCNLGPADPKESVLTDSDPVALLDALKLKPASVKWALVGTNLSFLKVIQDDYASIIKNHLGGQVVVNSSPGPAPGAPPLADWSPTAQQIINSGANVAFVLLSSGSQLEALTSALKAGGFKGVIYTDGVTGVDLSNPTEASILDGVYVETSWQSQTIFPGSYNNTIAADLKAIGANTTLADDNETVFSYMSADMFLQALASLKGPLSAEALVNMINGGWTFQGKPNGWDSITFPGARLSQLNYANVWEIKNGKHVPVLSPRDEGQNYFVPAG